MRLVGRCAALSVAAEIKRRARARRDGQPPEQPLTGFWAAETAGLAATTAQDRELTLEALRETVHVPESERAAARRRELRRR